MRGGTVAIALCGITLCVVGVWGEVAYLDEVTVVKSDPGQNVSVIWNISEPIPVSAIETITIYRQGPIPYVLFECNEKDCFTDTGGAAIGSKGESFADRIALLYYMEVTSNGRSVVQNLGFSVRDVRLDDTKQPVELTILSNTGELTQANLTWNAVLYVHQSPALPYIKVEGSTGIDQTLSLRCVSESQSLPESYRNTSELSYYWDISGGRGNYMIQGGEVMIKRIRDEDVGSTFQCSAREVNSNLMSQASSRFTLELSGLYGVEVRPWMNGVDSDILLSCSAECYPQCEYQWTGTEGMIRKLHDDVVLVERNFSVITCVASNKWGQISANLSESEIQRYSDDRRQYSRGVIIALATLLALAIAAIIAIVTYHMIYIRRQQPVQKQQSPKANISETFYENAAMKKRKSAEK